MFAYRDAEQLQAVFAVHFPNSNSTVYETVSSLRQRWLPGMLQQIRSPSLDRSVRRSDNNWCPSKELQNFWEVLEYVSLVPLGTGLVRH